MTNNNVKVSVDKEARRILENHDNRLRAVEISATTLVEILPRIETKLDEVLKSDHGNALTEIRGEIKGMDRELENHKENVDRKFKDYDKDHKELSENVTALQAKVWRALIVIAIIVGALHGLGVLDLTSIVAL